MFQGFPALDYAGTIVKCSGVLLKALESYLEKNGGDETVLVSYSYFVFSVGKLYL